MRILPSPEHPEKWCRSSATSHFGAEPRRDRPPPSCGETPSLTRPVRQERLQLLRPEWHLLLAASISQTCRVVGDGIDRLGELLAREVLDALKEFGGRTGAWCGVCSRGVDVVLAGNVGRWVLSRHLTRPPHDHSSSFVFI